MHEFVLSEDWSGGFPFPFGIWFSSFGKWRKLAAEPITQFCQSTLNALQSLFGMLDSLRQASRGKVKDDAKLIMGLCNLPRRKWKEFGLELDSSFIIRNGEIEFLCDISAISQYCQLLVSVHTCF